MGVYDDPYNLYKIEIPLEGLFNLLGDTGRDIVVLNRFLKAYCAKLFESPQDYRLTSVGTNDDKMKLESKSYDTIKLAYERLTRTTLIAFEISESVVNIMEWLESREGLQPKTSYRITSLFGKDLSIVFEDPKQAVEFKLRFNT